MDDEGRRTTIGPLPLVVDTNGGAAPAGLVPWPPAERIISPQQLHEVRLRGLGGLAARGVTGFRSSAAGIIPILLDFLWPALRGGRGGAEKLLSVSSAPSV
jgi:hypothetical protein